MRKVLLLTLATLTAALAGATSNATARPTTTVNVSIAATGFVPDEIRIRPGDTVVWKNNDTNNHQVVSDTNVFKSPVLKPGATYSHVFDTESSYSYHDSLKPATGEVHVVLNRVTAGITRPSAVFGSMVEVFGSIPNGASGEEVTVHITPFGGTETTRTVGLMGARTPSSTGRESRPSSSPPGTGRRARHHRTCSSVQRSSSEPWTPVRSSSSFG